MTTSTTTTTVTNNNHGISAPQRIAPLNGNAKLAAHQNMVNTSEQHNKLNQVVKGGNSIQVTTIKPIYKSTFQGDQDPTNQQLNQATTANKAMVQAQGDKVVLIKGGTHKRKGKRKSYRKSKKNKRMQQNNKKTKRKSRKHK